ncbi:MAG: MoaD/ThiS family protein [Roseateles asaccharophilus]|jgi:molybdopterin synthase sulfur carrier subunit|uniref:Molybdopterin synthase sulfur carrier subunit n=1 Tax=Roseateles asaccharophilus TaxID=582607 RepID=A0A4R6MZF5_9BURK|nr:MoaD/ThiS family protein [Roseateles asaccharophilus]MDN3545390.1 MoaD/ThiS family protein [Roseateles asaccharophilus]TDP07770.1 molybdopterin synthase subunit MoaD [Roseateles asaccharophilus]
MSITVRYFAALREALGASETLDWQPGLTLGALRDQLLARGEPHASALSRERALRCALNQQLSHEQAEVADGAEVAFFPPVTGG